MEIDLGEVKKGKGCENLKLKSLRCELTEVKNEKQSLREKLQTIQSISNLLNGYLGSNQIMGGQTENGNSANNNNSIFYTFDPPDIVAHPAPKSLLKNDSSKQFKRFHR